MPRNTATLVATVEYETVISDFEWLMMLMKKIDIGAYSTICRIELMATRIAQYWLSPPAISVQINTLVRFVSQEIRLNDHIELTMAIQRASPTRIRPSRRPGSSGRKAHPSPSYGMSAR